MPTYDYSCPNCKATYEAREGFDAPQTHTCQECGKGVAKRVLTVPRIVFKGSGWYATDSRSKQSAIADTSSDSGGGAEGSSETKSESKSEAKADNKSEAKGANKTKGESSGQSETKSEAKPTSENKTGSKSSDSVASAAS